MPDEQTQAFEELSTDPSLTAYRETSTGKMVFRRATNDPELTRQRAGRGLIPATPEEVARRAAYHENTTLLNQAASAGKLAARTATFGQVFDDPESGQSIEDFTEASPTAAAMSQMAGAVAPALVASTGIGAAAEAMGLAGRAAQIGATVAEEVAGNSAFEIEAAREEDRKISVGNIILGVGLGTGLSAAGRFARGAGRVEPGVLGAAEREGNVFAQGKRISGERRSVGAAGAEDKVRPATAHEVEAYAQAPEQFHAEVNQGAHDALADAFTGHEGVTGTSGGAARQVHGLAFKEQDVIPHMTTVDPEIATDAVYEHAEAAMNVANVLQASGQGLAAKRINAAAEAAIRGLDGADGTMIAAKGAVGLNRLKQEMDDVLGNYLRNKSVTAKSAGKEISKAVEPLRASLEDAGTWGDFWAERQVGENRLWSGDDGIIQMSNIWQPEVFETVKGKARVAVGDTLSEQMNRTPRADIAEHIMGLPRIKANKVLSAWESTVDQWTRMTELKEESGLTRHLLEDGTSPVDLLKQSLAQQKQMIDELRFLRDAGPRAKPILDKLRAIGPARATGEMMFEAAEHLPVVGHAVKAADKMVGVTGKSLKDRLFKAEALPPAAEITRDSALRAIAERQAKRGQGFVAPDVRGPGGGPGFPPPNPSRGGQGPVGGGKGGGDVLSGQVPGRHAPVERQPSATLKPETSDPVLSAVQAAAGRARGGRVTLAELRASLPGSRAEQDAALKQLQRDGKAVLMRNDNTPSLTKADHDAALTVGDSPRHLIYLTGAAALGAGALASGNAGAATITDHLAEISDNSRAIQERAALGLVVKESRAPSLPGIAARFKDGAPDLASAFNNRVADLRQATDDPMAFVQGMTNTFGGAAEEHQHLFTQMVARTQIGAQYLLANMPPSVGISMVRPEGIPPDHLAIMKFAAMYDSVFNPGNTVYDVGTGDATPTQIRALREVHPDIYGSLRAEVLKQIAQAGQNIPFETLRSLDNLFDLPGVAGPAFGPSMTKTMAQVWQNKSSPQKSLGGDSAIAPPQATGKLAGLSAVT